MTKKIIALFGAGYVTTTVVEYLTRRPENHLIIANRTLDHAITKAKLFAHNPDQVECVAIDVADPSEKNVKAMESLIEKSDVAISLVPYTYHVILAKICIAKKKHLVTTSYISAPMRELDQAAKDAGVILMNEIGVDPGIDHIAAVKIISEVHAKGGKINSFTSWCGGLPALDAIGDNPLKYKFSWSPRGVLMATSNTAKYLWDGAVKLIEPQNLMISAFSLNLHPEFEFDGYPNRDSTPYVQEYHIPEAKTVLRGTLRYKGFCKMMFYLRKLGLMDATERADLKVGAAPLKWKDLFAAQLGAKSAAEEDLTHAMLAKVELAADSDEGKRLISTTKWFGLYGDEAVSQKGTLLDAFSDLLQSKMVYGKGERDMIFLQHTFEIEWADGTKQKRTATLLCYGDGKENGFSSMAKTTGLPCAISTQLILDNIITRTGVIGPMYPDMNEHIEKALEKEGIVVEDKIIAE